MQGERSSYVHVTSAIFILEQVTGRVFQRMHCRHVKKWHECHWCCHTFLSKDRLSKETRVCVLYNRL